MFAHFYLTLVTNFRITLSTNYVLCRGLKMVVYYKSSTFSVLSVIQKINKTSIRTQEWWWCNWLSALELLEAYAMLWRKLGCHETHTALLSTQHTAGANVRSTSSNHAKHKKINRDSPFGTFMAVLHILKLSIGWVQRSDYMNHRNTASY